MMIFDISADQIFDSDNIQKRMCKCNMYAEKTIIIRSGSYLSADIIICDDENTAKTIIDSEIKTNINEAGDEQIDMNDSILVDSYPDLVIALSIACDKDHVYATVSPHGSVEWWIMVCSENTYTDKDYMC